MHEPAPPENPDLFRSLVRDLDEAVVLVDRAKRIVQVNRRAEQLTGLRNDDVAGRLCQEVLSCAAGNCRCDVFDTSPRAQVLELVTPNGKLLLLQRTPRVLRDAEGRVVGAMETLRQLEQNDAPRISRPSWVGDPAEAAPLRAIIGRSDAIRRLVDRIRRVANTAVPVLVTGESGTGKELTARALHALSPRRNRPFVAINCAALPADLIESELFGHVRGAFTGAVRDRVGAVEAAEGGTFLLDEIGDLAPSVQVKLLRLLQERTFRRVGETRERTADIRIVAATHVDLERAVRDGLFRADLYYRLRVVPIHIPALRDRPEDIHPLASTLLAQRAVTAGRLPMRFSPEAMRRLEAHTWPGNVRELGNVVDYLVALCPDATVGPRDLPEDLQASRTEPTSIQRGRYRPPTCDDVSEPERIRSALEDNDFHRQRTADALGMDRVTLYRKMKAYGIEGIDEGRRAILPAAV